MGPRAGGRATSSSAPTSSPSRRSSPGSPAPSTASAWPTAPTHSSWHCAPAASGAATRWCCRPTRSSPPPRPSAAPALARCWSTAIPSTCSSTPIGSSAAVTGRTRAVVAVHLYGQMAPVDGLRQRPAGEHRHHRGRGAVAGRDPPRPGQRQRRRRGGHQLLPRQEPRRLRRRGGRAHERRGDGGHAAGSSARTAATRKYVHDRVGMNSRLDTLQAVVLRAKLRRLAGWNAQRRQAAPAVRGAARRPGRRRAADRPGGQRARVAPLRGAGAAPRRGPRPPGGGRHRGGHPLPAAGPPAGRVPGAGLWARRLPRGRGGRR